MGERFGLTRNIKIEKVKELNWPTKEINEKNQSVFVGRKGKG